MAEALKRHFGVHVVRGIAAQVAAAWPSFRAKTFIADALEGFDALELMPRGVHLAHALKRHLPAGDEHAISVLCRAAGKPRTPNADAGGMDAFFYLPYVCFISEFGVPHFEASMRAQHELTQRFTAEFSIRAFLEADEARTLQRLHEWTSDSSEHVRRLVSEGTRPRLPWARRLRRFQKDPTPVLALLEKLKDDSSLYVRRSVANNLNDIGKDHPAILIATAERWMKGASEDRRALVKHALRSLVKAGDKQALEILGFGHKSSVRIAAVEIEPRRVPIGGKVRVTVTVRNPGREGADALIDLRVHFVKSDGAARPKVFKLGIVSVAPRSEIVLRKTVSLAELTTRKHYAGRHLVDFLINGAIVPGAEFAVLPMPGRAR